MGTPRATTAQTPLTPFASTWQLPTAPRQLGRFLAVLCTSAAVAGSALLALTVERIDRQRICSTQFVRCETGRHFATTHQKAVNR